ncbi:MAG: aromatic ring-hydroxylating dioxygenase subunit alpha, partial [Pyrinomonadaceae bacterium]|nr:aromatic ring-hydroxylating dioxygenase subunit alpha [Pyrinomonadaceae bacterium]
MNDKFSFDERLEFAETIPSRCYIAPDIFEQEKSKVFLRTWQLVGRAAQVVEPGEYFTAAVADEPVIVARGNDSVLRSFSNVCRHRAGQVAEGSGKRKSFQCLYHGWTYALDGRLTGTPEFGGVQCFEKETNALPQFKVDVWNGLIFVNLDSEAPPLAEVFGDLTTRVRHARMEGMRLATRKDWYIDCNWKVYVDNYLEGYHIPYAHPSLNRAIDYAEYRTETFPY